MPYFLKIDGIAGDSVDAKHKGEIEVESFSFGVSQNASAPPTGGGAAAIRATFDDLHVVTAFSRASPRLLQACAAGERLRSAVLTGLRAGGKEQFEFMTLTLSDVLVSAYRSGAATVNAAIPSDEFSLAFQKLQIEHKAVSPSGAGGGSTVAGFDLKSNAEL